jgi:hypothetical protein
MGLRSVVAAALVGLLACCGRSDTAAVATPVHLGLYVPLSPMDLAHGNAASASRAWLYDRRNYKIEHLFASNLTVQGELLLPNVSIEADYFVRQMDLARYRTLHMNVCCEGRTYSVCLLIGYGARASFLSRTVAGKASYAPVAVAANAHNSTSTVVTFALDARVSPMLVNKTPGSPEKFAENTSQALDLISDATTLPNTQQFDPVIFGLVIFPNAGSATVPVSQLVSASFAQAREAQLISGLYPYPSASACRDRGGVADGGPLDVKADSPGISR